MASKVKNLVEYTGFVDESEIQNSSCCFRKFVLNHKVSVPETRPGMGKLVKIAACVQVNEARVVHTDKTTSLDGQILTGKKGVIDGVIGLRIEYVENTNVEEVHSLSFEIPFSTYVILPENICRLSKEDAKINALECYTQIFDEKDLSVNLILVTIVDCN